MRLFCLPWNVNSDEWWTHHVEWYVSEEHDDKYCYSLIPRAMKRHAFRQIYNVQFQGDCSQVLTKRMWSSGWGADFGNIVDGMIRAMDTKRPFQIWNKKHWHYAAKKDGSRPVCPGQSIACYFLPLGGCEPNPKKVFNDTFYYKLAPMYRVLDNRLFMEFATRPQTWLRKAVYEFSKKIELSAPCTVMHVRRGDVVLHDDWSRRYHAIEEYVHATEKISNTIFLLTDDDNAIKEAHEKFPDFHWVHIERQRFKGKEGGWENHIPSDDPKLEVIILMSIFAKVGTCKMLIHTRSSFADYIAGVMMNARGRDFVRVNIDKDRSNIYNRSFAETFDISSKKSWKH